MKPLWFLLCCLYLLSPILSKGQTDTEFWFVAPEIYKSGSANWDIPVYLRISAYNQAATVTVSQPANTLFTPIVSSIPANGFTTINLSPFLDMVENKPANTVLNYGLYIVSTSPVSIYYELASTYCNCNPELWTLKGRNALGTNFLIPTQNYFYNQSGYNPLPYNAFDIVATQNNTTVTITPSKPILGHAAGVPFNITLNRGQTWSGLATSQAAINHLWGTKVVSNHAIAITMTDDALFGITACVDAIGDQIVPVNITGTDYVVIRGNLTNNGNRAFILATQDNTNIYIDGNSVPAATLATGQLYNHLIINPSSSISANHPVYVFQTSGFGCELGGALIPSINCNGSQQVAFTRTNNQELGLVIATRSTNIGSFLLNGNPSLIPASAFSVVPGTSGNWRMANLTYTTSQIPVGSVVTVSNTIGTFHLGLLIGNADDGCSYGYFSNFSGLNLGPDISFCNGSSATIHAGAGWSGYLWNTGATTEAITVTTAGIYSVTVTDPQCTLYDSISVTVNPSNLVSISIAASATTVCEGNSVTFNAIAVNPGTFPVYHWKVNGVNTGPNNPAFTYVPSNGDVVTCELVSNVTCGLNNPALSNQLIMSVLPAVPVSVSVTVSNTSVCAGTMVTFTAVPVNPGSSPIYQWKVNGIIAGSNNPSFIYPPATGDIVTCRLTSSLPCTQSNPAISQAPQVTVVPVSGVSVTVTVSETSVCAGATVTYIATPVNPGTAPAYAWSVNGIPAGTNSPLFYHIPSPGDVVGCQLTSSLPCTLNNPSVGLAPTVTVIPVDTVDISIIASATDVCTGTSVIFTAIPVNPGAFPAFLWKVNGSVAGNNAATFTYVPLDGDVISCQLTSSLNCTSNNPASSNPVTIHVIPEAPVSVTISASETSVCAGMAVTLTAFPVNPGTSPVCQWSVNGSIAGSNTPVFTYIPSDDDTVICQLTSSLGCTSNNPALSNPVNIAVTALSPVFVTIAATAVILCEGDPVTFTASATNPGTNPGFQWFVDGQPAGTNTPAYTFTPTDGDTVICQLTSSLTCPENNPVASQPVFLTVTPNSPVSVTISSSANPVCEGTTVLFTAQPGNPGSSPSYQWSVNGLPVGSNQSSYSCIPSDSDLVTCRLTSSLTCTVNNPTTSQPLLVTVIPNEPVSITVNASATTVCSGTPVSFSAIPVNPGINPGFIWRVNNLTAGSNSPLFTFLPADGDMVTCQLTSGLTCTTGNPARSNAVLIHVNPLPEVTFSICSDTVTSVGAQPYTLHGGMPPGGIYTGPGIVSSPVFSPPLAGVGLTPITYTYVNVNQCSASSNATIRVLPYPAFTCGEVFTDVRDGQSYPTLQQGNRCWLQRNLNFGQVIQGSIAQMDNCRAEKYCYKDKLQNCTNYGGLYQWDEAMGHQDTEGVQGLCPPGWHVPGREEWQELFAANQGQALAGRFIQNTSATGFNALPGGVIYNNLHWDYQGFATLFWTSTALGDGRALSHGFNRMDFSICDYPGLRSNALPVRCVKD